MLLSAFDSVRHSTLFSKYAELDLPDLYIWLVFLS